MDEETEMMNLPKFTWLLSGGARFQIQVAGSRVHDFISFIDWLI